MNKILISLITVFVVLGVPMAKADIAERSDDFVYVFHLYFDGQNLVVDNTAKYPYDVVADLFLQGTMAGVPFRGKVLSVKGELIEEFTFSAPSQAGKVLVRAPYFANAGDVVFSNSLSHEIMKISVAESSFCNNDNICNKDVGEDWKNCRSDCAEPAVTIPVTSSTVVPTEIPSGFGWSTFILVGAMILVGLIVAFFIFRSRNDNISK